MPPWTHRWNQSWTVLLGPYRSGSWSHWQPLRNRKMIALSIFRQLATWRPVGFLGQNSLRMGSIRRQSSSGISQIVGSGLGRVLVRVMVMAPVATFGGLFRLNLLQAKSVPTFSDSFLTRLSVPMIVGPRHLAGDVAQAVPAQEMNCESPWGKPVSK